MIVTAPFRRVAPLTLAIAATAVAAHIYGEATGGAAEQARLYAMHQLWVEGFIADEPLRTLLLYPVLAIVTALLHFDWVHLGVNLVMLLFLGRQLELPYGSLRFGLLWCGGALGGALAESLIGPAALVAGMSGATSALLAAYALLFGTQQPAAIGPLGGRAVRVIQLALGWVLLQLLIGFATGGGIAIWGHIGGFAAGLALARPLLRSRYRST